MAEGIRIQKALADAGVASRRAADELVSAGRVSVNGRPAITGQRVDPLSDHIEVDGRPLGARPGPVYLLISKPVGVTSTVSDRHAERTVVELVPPDILRTAGRIYPVGRLDRDSEGLLLLTNDGDWAQRVLHPRHEIEREYAIGLGQPLSIEQVRALEAGIPLDEGLATLERLRLASGVESSRLEELAGRSARPLTWYRAVLRQGWRRQLRRMFAAVSAPVERLVRVRIGSLRLETLRPGEVRPLTASERDRLVAGSQRRARQSTMVAPSTAAAPSTMAAPATAAASSVPGSGSAGMVVSIDGPGSSGKSSVGAAAALGIGYRFCDTGVLYRALAWLALERGLDLADGSMPADPAGLVALIDELELAADEHGRLRRVLVDGMDVTEQLHAPEVDRVVSVVAREPAVRAALLPMQRGLAAGGSIVVAGRDIGSVVFPDADLKLYLDVSLDERARRRARERGVALDTPEATRIRDDLARRDGIDSSRETAPLLIPAGASVIHADRLTFDATVTTVVRRIRDAAYSRAAAATQATQREIVP